MSDDWQEDDGRIFQRPGEPPLAHLPPDQALARSVERLRRLEALALAPHLTPRRRKVIENVVGAAAAIVVARQRIAGHQINWPKWPLRPPIEHNPGGKSALKTEPAAQAAPAARAEPMETRTAGEEPPMGGRAKLAVGAATCFAIGALAALLVVGRYSVSAGAGPYFLRLDRLTGETAMCNATGCRTLDDVSRADAADGRVASTAMTAAEAANDASAPAPAAPQSWQDAPLVADSRADTAANVLSATAGN